MVAAVELDGVIRLPLIAADDEVEMGLQAVALQLRDDATAMEIDDVASRTLG